MTEKEKEKFPRNFSFFVPMGGMTLHPAAKTAETESKHTPEGLAKD